MNGKKKGERETDRHKEKQTDIQIENINLAADVGFRHRIDLDLDIFG